MGYGEIYGGLLKEIAEEADAIAMRYFRGDELRIDRKGDGTAVTQADRGVEEMARARVAARGFAPGGFWGGMGGGGGEEPDAWGGGLVFEPREGTGRILGGV